MGSFTGKEEISRKSQTERKIEPYLFLELQARGPEDLYFKVFWVWELDRIVLLKNVTRFGLRYVIYLSKEVLLLLKMTY